MIFIDFETCSNADLKKVGAFKYSCDLSTDIRCMAYSVDGSPPCLWVPGQPLPDLHRHRIAAWNVTFDWLIWQHVATRRYGFPSLDIHRLVDVMAMAAYANRPLALDRCARSFGLQGKHQEGVWVLHKLKHADFSPTRDMLDVLYAYCKQDVALMVDLYQRLPSLPTKEQAIWRQCLLMNLRGVPVDEEELSALVWHVEKAQQSLNRLIPRLTGQMVESVTQVAKLKAWLEKETGVSIPGVDKKTVSRLLETTDSPAARQVLRIRQQIGLTSNLKYKRALDTAINGRIHDHTVYYGAGTGREAGRGIQLQNLKRTKTAEKAADNAIANFKVKDEGFIRLLYGNDVLEVLSGLVRSIIKAPLGSKFLCADFSSIENVAAPWVTGEKKLLEAFERGLDQYKVAASDMFHTSYDNVTGDQRQAGKVTCLACQYAGGYRALLSMASNYGMDITEDQARQWVQQFRRSRPRLVQTWSAFGRAAVQGLRHGRAQVASITFRRTVHGLAMDLPAGRSIYYPKPSVQPRDSIQTEFRGVIKTLSGANFFQNAVQAICRDLLMEAKLRLEEAGYPVIISVHDEVLCEVPDNPDYKLDELIAIMTKVPTWAKGLPIRADGWEGRRYRK